MTTPEATGRADLEHAGEQFNPAIFAKLLLEKYTFKTTRDNETLYVYDTRDKIYKPNGEVFVKEEIVKALGDDARQKYFGDIAFVVKGSTYFDRPTTPINKLVVENGVLDPVNCTLEENNTTDFLTIRLPVKYDPQADCPAVKKFLTEVVGEAYVDFIQEFSGYLLCQTMPYHRVPLLTGEGMNGKTTLADFLVTFLGQANVSSISIQQLCENRFSAYQLVGKLCNVCDDLPDKTIRHSGTFKMLAGNSIIQVEQKFHDSFPTINTAKMIYLANKVPDADDDTDAYFRRWTLIPCNNKFQGTNRDVHMLEKLTTPTELSGFLNFALAGLKRLLADNDFCIQENLEQQRKSMIWASNSAKAYITEHLETTKDHKDRITKDTLYSSYITFCKENSLFVKTSAVLTKSIKQLLPDAKETSVREGLKVLHGWQYLRLCSGSSICTGNSLLIAENQNLNNNNSETSIDSPAQTQHLLQITNIESPATPDTTPTGPQT
jgi:putative DNA primase/helicase